MKIAINGAGIAGPTLASWPRRSGHDVVLIEESPRLRRGGYVIDFWGVGYDIAERMGLLARVRALGYQVQEVRFVDRHGRRRGGFPTAVIHRLTSGRFTSLRRSDLAATIDRALDDKVETILGVRDRRLSAARRARLCQSRNRGKTDLTILPAR